jgi:hypothetical protein
MGIVLFTTEIYANWVMKEELEKWVGAHSIWSDMGIGSPCKVYLGSGLNRQGAEYTLQNSTPCQSVACTCTFSVVPFGVSKT